MEYKKYHLNNYNLYVIPMKRYKTTNIFFEFIRKYEKGDNAKSRIAHFINSYGTLKYPNKIEYQRSFMPVYFPTVNFYYQKEGKYGAYGYSCYYLNPEYSKNNILDEMLPFLHEIIYTSLSVDENYIKKYLKEAKKIKCISHRNNRANPKNRIGDNSDRYFLLEHYDIDNPTITQYNKTTTSDIINFMQRYLHDSVLNIYVCGDVAPDEVYQSFKRNFVTDNLKPQLIKDKDIIEPRSKERHKVVKSKVDDTLVRICYTFDKLTEREEKIIGPFFECLTRSYKSLFNVVREKNSLCYNISAKFNGYGHYYFIYFATSNKNYKKAIEIAEAEIDRFKDGEIEQKEITDTINQVVEMIQSNMNDVSYIVQYIVDSVNYGDKTPEERIIEYKDITKEEIVAFANKLRLDCTYVSKGVKNE